MFRIRFHGRGGQGIKTSSRILGSALFREGFEVQDAPLYGAERRGAPMFAYVRAGRAPIQERGLITNPDLVIVADESLVSIPAARVLLGVTPRSVLLINSAAEPADWRRRLNLENRMITLPVGDTARERAGLPFIGAVCAGAAARLVGRVARASLEAAIRDEFGALGGEIMAHNLEHALTAYEAMAPHAGCVPEGAAIAADDYTRPGWIDVPFETARVSAPDIHAAATSVQIKTGAWRSQRPVIDYARCSRCHWICSTMCPDSAISVADDGRPVIDYDHCKGCLVCVAVCPPHAIDAEPEGKFKAAGTVAEAEP
jgi:pyruvate ferredoxin oxidoreductase gamma subunit